MLNRDKQLVGIIALGRKRAFGQTAHCTKILECAEKGHQTLEDLTEAATAAASQLRAVRGA